MWIGSVMRRLCRSPPAFLPTLGHTPCRHRVARRTISRNDRRHRSILTDVDVPLNPDAALAAVSGLDFPVVGIGASAGGLAAIKTLLEGLPASPDMAFVVVLHLSPTHESNAARILQLSTRMPVTQVTGRV